MKKQILPAIAVFLGLTVVTGVVYPITVNALASLFFPFEAHGSLIHKDGQVVGSELIGQSFSDPAHFWGRPSATAPHPYDAQASGGSNLGPLNPALLQLVQERIKAFRTADPDNHGAIPVDLVTASASGLDPDISIAAARFQAGRVARTRGVSVDQIVALIDQIAVHPKLAGLSEPTVNILQLNLRLDEHFPVKLKQSAGY